MPVVDSNYSNKDEEATVFSGISIVEILETQGIEEYSELTLIASDGYTARVSYDELSVCSECILSYSEDNNWSTVMPNFSGKLQVKDVVELSVK